MWALSPARAVSKQLAAVTDESWGDADTLPVAARPVAKPAVKVAAPVATKATTPVKAVPAAVEAGPITAPAPQPERPKLKSVTSIAAAMSGRVTRPIDAVKPAPAKVEAKPAPVAPAPVKAEVKPAPLKVELKPLRPLAPLKPIENKPLPSLRPIGTRPMEAQKPAPRPAPVKAIAPLKPILAAELPPLPQVKLPGMPPAQARATTSGRLAEGSIPPPMSQATASKPLPSLFSVIDRKRPAPVASPRPKVVARVVAGALTAVAPLASAAPQPAAPSQSDVMAKQAVELDEPDYIPLTAEDLIEDAVPELLAQEDFIPMDMAVLPAPLPPVPRVGHGSGATFSALEESFFAAGERS
ncbi:MAG TPA: hypothetical protein VMZ28_27350, partial [Kofleriaceae bacterium]|nr:hypothetical protein [Kofleriaceae bacterium]